MIETRLAAGTQTYDIRDSFTEVIAVVPPPAAWPKLIEEIRAPQNSRRSERSAPVYIMRMVAAVLANEPAALEKEKKVGKKSLRSQNDEIEMLITRLTSVRRTLSTNGKD